MSEEIARRREMLKSGFGLAASPMSQADQAAGAPRPPFEKAVGPDDRVIDLPGGSDAPVSADFRACVADRRSRRKYADAPISLDELAYLLWATAGVRDLPDGSPAMRTVPSAGARHPLDTYLAVLNVTGLEAGLYRYLSLSHRLVFVEAVESLRERIGEASCGQMWVGAGAAVFFWAATPYRSEWRYHTDAAKLVLLDAGHVCQNLYLAAESIGCGVCGIGAYNQQAIDKLLGLDGVDEFVVYYAPVGKAPPAKG